MLWFKAFHVIFVVTWFAGLFYLPRLLMHHSIATDQVSIDRFMRMEKGLFTIMTIGAGCTLFFAFAMILREPAYLQAGWLRLKLVFVGCLIVYHLWCFSLMDDLKRGQNRYSVRWYKLFNEVPSVLLIAIVILAVVKPF